MPWPRRPRPRARSPARARRRESLPACFNSLVLQSHSPIPWRVAWGPRSRETEILIGVLAATVRDPSRSGPGARLTHGLAAQEHVGVGRRPEPIFHAPRGVPRRDWGLIRK